MKGNVRFGLVSACWLALELICGSAPCHGVDLSGGVRNVRVDRDWMSMQVHDPIVGRFLATRASTQDEARHATINVTFSPEGNQCKETVEILFELATPAKDDQGRDETQIEFAFDDKEPLVHPATAEWPRGDRFVYLNLESKSVTPEFQSHRTVLVNARIWGWAKFSLLGFTKARDRARSLCGGWVTPE